MAVQLRAVDANGSAPDENVGYVEFSLGEEQAVEQSKQWVAARVWLNVPNTRSSAQVQLIAVRTARDLLVAESERLERLHNNAERSQP